MGFKFKFTSVHVAVSLVCVCYWKLAQTCVLAWISSLTTTQAVKRTPQVSRPEIRKESYLNKFTNQKNGHHSFYLPTSTRLKVPKYFSSLGASEGTRQSLQVCVYWEWTEAAAECCWYRCKRAHNSSTSQGLTLRRQISEASNRGLVQQWGTYRDPLPGIPLHSLLPPRQSNTKKYTCQRHKSKRVPGDRPP